MLTYFDLVESLIVSSYGGPQDAEQRDIRTAIHRAYAELTTIRDWQWYSAHGRLITDSPYSTGTVTVSGAAVTGSGTAFPAWAASGGYLKIGEQIARVASRSSNTALTLDSALPLKANVTAQPYTLYRTIYPLPADFRNMDEPSDEYNWWSGLYITPDQAMKLERSSNTSGSPLHWTVLKNPYGDGWSIKLIGYPIERETIDFTYRRTARALRWSGHEAGARLSSVTVQDEGASASWTGPDPEVSSGVVGSVMRIGGVGVYPGPIESLTPYVDQSYISAFTGSRALELTGLSQNYSGVAALITDPIDVAPHMEQAMDSACDYWLSRIRGTKPEQAAALYQRDLRLAMEQEQLAPLSGRSRNVWHDGGWRSPLRADNG